MPSSKSKRFWLHAALLSTAGLLLYIGLYGISLAFPFTDRDSRANSEPTGQTNEPFTYTETIPGSDVTFDMVPIPGGTYLMGSPANEAGNKPDESPQHPVTIRVTGRVRIDDPQERGVEARKQRHTALSSAPFFRARWAGTGATG